eukprot:Gb_14382 [translate_table: standard]
MELIPTAVAAANNYFCDSDSFRRHHRKINNKMISCVGLINSQTIAIPIRTSPVKITQKRNGVSQGNDGSSGIGTNISGLCREGRLKEALDLLHVMDQQGTRPDTETFASLLQACSNRKALREGKQVHGHLLQSEIEQNVFLGTKLVIMYTNCGSLVDACQVFDKMSQRNVFSWTAMIAGHASHGHCEEALVLLYQMQRTGVAPDKFIFPSVLKACASLGALKKGKEIHAYIIKSEFERDVFVESALVDMYAKCRCLDDGRQVFDKMCRRNSVSWSAMISGYAHNGFCNEAMNLFHEMQFTGLKPNVMSWNAIIAGYSQNGYADESLKLFCQMQRAGVKPDSFTFGSVLPACAILADLKQGMVIHGYIIKTGLVSNVFVASALTDTYSKCGRVEDARDVFENISQRNVFSWTSMIAGLAHNGFGDEALKFFRQMLCKGVEPNSVTIASLLPACAYVAALEQGKEVHAYIIRRGFETDVFVGSALVDMYAKCGSIESARYVFDKMLHVDLVLWNSMIAGYAIHGQGEEALTLFSHMQLADVKPNHITFIGVLSACSHAGLVNQGWQYFDLMRRDYCITPTLEHYACIVDLLGRAGHLDDAHDFIQNMPLEPDAFVWGALLGACRIYCNVELGECVAKHLFELEPRNAGSYVLLSNIYASAGRWDGVAEVRKMMKERGLSKKPGCSWIEVNNKLHAFLAGDRSHPQTKEIYAMLESLGGQMKDAGYMPDPNFVLHDV